MHSQRLWRSFMEVPAAIEPHCKRARVKLVFRRQKDIPMYILTKRLCIVTIAFLSTIVSAIGSDIIKEYIEETKAEFYQCVGVRGSVEYKITDPGLNDLAYPDVALIDVSLIKGKNTFFLTQEINIVTGARELLHWAQYGGSDGYDRIASGSDGIVGALRYTMFCSE